MVIDKICISYREGFKATPHLQNGCISSLLGLNASTTCIDGAQKTGQYCDFGTAVGDDQANPLSVGVIVSNQNHVAFSPLPGSTATRDRFSA